MVNTEGRDKNKPSLVKRKQPCEEAEMMKINKNMKFLRIVLRSTVDYWWPPSKKKRKAGKNSKYQKTEAKAGDPATIYRKLFLLSCFSNSTK